MSFDARKVNFASPKRKTLQKITSERDFDGTGFRQVEHWDDHVDCTVRPKTIAIRTVQD